MIRKTLLFITCVFIMGSYIIQKEPKEEVLEKLREPYAYDYVNGRYIYPEDTAFLVRHPYRYDEWIPKSELEKAKRSRGKPQKPDNSYAKSLDAKIEDAVMEAMDAR